MADQEEQEQESEEEQSQSGSEPEPMDPRLAWILDNLTPDNFHRLMQLTEDRPRGDTYEMAGLKEVAPGFKGDFINFTLKDTVYADMAKEAPDYPVQFPVIDITPQKKVYPKDVAEVRAMDEKLTFIAKTLQLALQYEVSALISTDDRMDENITDGVFCGLCMTAHALSALQLERYTTAQWRGKIAEVSPGSQVPDIVKKIKKSFFRGKGGSAEEPPSEDEEEEAPEPMGKARRTQKRRWFTQRRPRGRTAPSYKGGFRLYQPHPGLLPSKLPFRGRGRGRGGPPPP
jgi:hypothetical protein